MRFCSINKLRLRSLICKPRQKMHKKSPNGALSNSRGATPPVNFNKSHYTAAALISSSIIKVNSISILKVTVSLLISL